MSQALVVRSLIGGEPVPTFDALRPCRAGQGWQWDGVRFRVLHPSRNMTADNDRSCVLSIENGRRRALLPGDITRVGEADLLASLPEEPLDLLVAAHHGSRSSSTAAFVDATRPRVVAFSAGFKNRFGRPHADVVCRFERVGSRTFLTAVSGALSWHSDRPTDVVQWRYRSPPYWRVGTSPDIGMSSTCTGAG